MILIFARRRENLLFDNWCLLRNQEREIEGEKHNAQLQQNTIQSQQTTIARQKEILIAAQVQILAVMRESASVLGAYELRQEQHLAEQPRLNSSLVLNSSLRLSLPQLPRPRL